MGQPAKAIMVAAVICTSLAGAGAALGEQAATPYIAPYYQQS